MSATDLSTFKSITTKAAPTNALEVFEAERQAAVQRGYNEGLEAAHADVLAATDDANKRVRRALAALCEAVDGFDTRETIALADVEDAIVAGALSIARAILQHELSAMVDPGAEALARAMQLAPSRGDVVARFHPSDVETLSMESVSTSTRSVQVIADASVEPGGCIIEISDTKVDAQLSSALAKVSEALGTTFSSGLELLQSQKNNKENNSVVAGSNLSDSRTTSEEAPE